MANLVESVKNTLTSIVVRAKMLKLEVDNAVGDVSQLSTTDKTTVVNAVNELNTMVLSLQPVPINDDVVSATTEWSSLKIDETINNLLPSPDTDPTVNMYDVVNNEWNKP